MLGRPCHSTSILQQSAKQVNPSCFKIRSEVNPRAFQKFNAVSCSIFAMVCLARACIELFRRHILNLFLSQGLTRAQKGAENSKRTGAVHSGIPTSNL